MAANRAGIAFATVVLNQRLSLEDLAKGFDASDYLPPVKELAEALGATEFALRYGDVLDPRYVGEMRRIEDQIKALPVYLGSP